jgi:3-hydroxybutyrate dehydrogenase
LKKVALVTGAASGIGLACAERFARDGCAVVLADVNEPQGRDHASRLKADFVKTDLTTREGCKTLVEDTLKKHGTVHILVNNAGFQHVSPIEEFPEDQVADFAAYLCSDAAGVITGSALAMDLGWTAR